MASDSPLGLEREAEAWLTGCGQLRGGTGPSHAGTAPKGGVRVVEAKTVGPADKWPQLQLHHFLALPQFTHLLNEDSLP